MDPNAAARELADLRADLATCTTPVDRQRGYDIAREIHDVIADLREWRDKGGFAPHGGWPAGV